MFLMLKTDFYRHSSLNDAIQGLGKVIWRSKGADHQSRKLLDWDKNDLYKSCRISNGHYIILLWSYI